MLATFVIGGDIEKRRWASVHSMQFFCNLFSFIFISKVDVVVVVVVVVIIVVVVVLVLDIKPMGAYWYQITRWTVTGKKTKYGRLRISFSYMILKIRRSFSRRSTSLPE